MTKKHQKNAKNKRKYKMWPLEHNSVAHGEVGLKFMARKVSEKAWTSNKAMVGA